jgi:hypothetical protein
MPAAAGLPEPVCLHLQVQAQPETRYKIWLAPCVMQPCMVQLLHASEEHFTYSLGISHGPSVLAASAAGVCQACKDPRFKKKSHGQPSCMGTAAATGSKQVHWRQCRAATGCGTSHWLQIMILQAPS